jgi:hypothetical protein
VDVSDRTDAYQRLFIALWEAGQDFMLVEHDTELTLRALRQARGCSCLWGVNPYRGPGGNLLTRSLGCVRFRAPLLAAIPDMGRRLETLNDGKDVPLGHWKRLDARVAGVLRDFDLAFEPHLHLPEVRQHHVYQGRCACGVGHEEYPVDQEGRYIE